MQAWGWSTCLHNKATYQVIITDFMYVHLQSKANQVQGAQQSLTYICLPYV